MSSQKKEHLTKALLERLDSLHPSVRNLLCSIRPAAKIQGLGNKRKRKSKLLRDVSQRAVESYLNKVAVEQTASAVYWLIETKMDDWRKDAKARVSPIHIWQERDTKVQQYLHKRFMPFARGQKVMGQSDFDTTVSHLNHFLWLVDVGLFAPILWDLQQKNENKEEEEMKLSETSSSSSSSSEDLSESSSESSSSEDSEEEPTKRSRTYAHPDTVHAARQDAYVFDYEFGLPIPPSDSCLEQIPILTAS